jgi:hypothetical protein
MHLTRMTCAAAVAAAAVAVASAAASAASGAGSLRIDVTEWAAVPSNGLVAAGHVRLTVTDVGELPHRVVIVRTRNWGDPPPVGRAAIARAMVGRPLLVRPGTAASETLTLTSGSYLAFDDLPGHHALATVAFSVA